MSQWIKCSDKLPNSEPGRWSEDVIALSDIGDVFRLACTGSYWQRTGSFIESGSNEVVAWMPLPEPPEGV